MTDQGKNYVYQKCIPLNGAVKPFELLTYTVHQIPFDVTPFDWACSFYVTLFGWVQYLGDICHTI